MRLFAIVVATVILVSDPVNADQPWKDKFYQYRIPLVVDVEAPGWNAVPLSEAVISEAIGHLEEYSFDPQFLAYNHLRVLNTNGDDVEAGFFLIVNDKELIGENPALPVPTKRQAYYLVRFVSEGGRFPPTVGYEQVFPVGEPPRTHAYMSSYLPRLLPKKRTRHECLLRSDGTDLKLLPGGTTQSTEISVRSSRIAFLAHFDSPGRKQLVLYYQPFGAHYLKIPKRRRATLPRQSAKVASIGQADKYVGRTKYALQTSNAAYRLWFADTTVKLTPTTTPPRTGSRKAIEITSAANEAQSFQVVLSPNSDFEFQSVRASAFQGEHGSIDASRVEVRQVDYVPVTKKARVNQVKFFGRIGDPLIKVTPRRVRASAGNLAFWVTIRTPPGTAGGDYSGTLSIVGKGGASSDIPVKLTVYDFELPEYSTFRSNMGGQYFAKNGGNAKLNPTMVYHGVTSKSGLKKLARTYYDFMAREKFYPKNVALFVDVGMKWKAPRPGKRVDADNYFQLVDWDFAEFNRCLKHFIDDLKVNSVCLTHTNPSVSHIFKHLPGEPVAKFNGNPGHVTMAWQTFRKMTQATYLKKPGDPWFDTSLLVTRKQWDRLLLDYYRAMVRNLDANGWTDKVYYFIDETSGTDKILHLIRLLKSDPLTAKIRFAHCLQGFESLWHREDGKYKFNKLVTHVPQIDENYYRWEKYYWDDYNVPRNRDRLWSYAAYSSRLGINVPGMTNRQVGLEVFNLGGSGYVIWDTLMWHHTYGKAGDPHNPWKEPYARLANGALCYFYPPRRNGMPKRPDFTVTPSLRVMTFRESVDDYEYARILEDLVVAGRRQGRNVSEAAKVLMDIRRMFPNSVEWTLNDAWYLDLRDRMARAIVRLTAKEKD